MKTSSKGIELIKRFEGCRLEAYRCPAGVPTIGYGHTTGVKMGQRITQNQAERMLVEDLKKFEGYVKNDVTSFRPNQNQFDSLVSFAYNCGRTNLRTLTGGRDAQTVAKKLLLYNKAGGRTLAGLTRRRKAEQALFLTKGVNRPVIRKGSCGDDVKDLQEILSSDGYDCGKADGIFGIRTQMAVIAFQAGKGITKDGIVGKETWREILK